MFCVRDLPHLTRVIQPVTIILKLMKWFLQIVAVVAGALLAAQPALAGLSCEMGTPTGGHCAPCCREAMNRMGMDCPMQQQAAATGCDQNCCSDALPQGVAELTSGVKPKIVIAKFFAVAPRLVTDAGTAFAAAPPGKTAAAAPARYILFQVFRI